MADLAHEAQQSRQTQPDVVIKVQNVSKIFHTPSQANLSALTDIELDIRPGEFVTVVGPSGCGKSTLLKLIAGFSPVSAGRILFQGDEVRGLNTESATYLRKASSFPGSPSRKTSVSD